MTQISPIVVGHVVAWVVKNRRGAAFKDYTRNKIYAEVMESIESEVFRYTFDDKGLTGVVCGVKDDDKKHIYIYDILTTSKGALKALLKTANQSFPNYEIFGKVRSRKRHFKSLDNLIKKVK